MSRRVLITGTSIAGNTAAWWLGRAGFAVTVVERAPAFRDGGQNVDVRGIGRTILREMGITPLAGIGATLAITGARLLAGEMARGDDLPGAFAAYERAMRPMVEEAQGVPKLAPRLMHPRTRPGIRLLHAGLWAASTPLLRNAAARLFGGARTEPDLSRYAGGRDGIAA